MAVAQPCGDPFCQCGCGAWLGQCREAGRSLRARRAIYAMPALSDIEEPGPSYRIQPMPDNDDPKEAATLLPTDTDRAEADQGDRKTKPPEPEAEERALTIQRDALRAPGMPADSYFGEAAKEFAGAAAELRATRAEIAKGFRDQEAKQVERHAETTANAQLVASAIRAHGDRLVALERGADATLESVKSLKEEIRLARAAADEAVRLARQALDLVVTLEEKLDEDAAARAQAASAPTAAT